MDKVCDACRESGDGDSSSVEARVREQISRLLQSDPTIMAVAEALGMTVRTLQRRLAANNLAYRQILDELRRRKAERELMSRARSVAEIAQRLGYSDPSHFVRAFRRWTGCPPSQFADSRRGPNSRIEKN